MDRGRCLGCGCCRGGASGDAGRRRQHRHPGQQRRHLRPQHADLGVPGGRLAPGDRYRSQRPLPGVPRGGAADEGRWLGAHRQHRLGSRQGGQPQCARLQRGEGRPDRAYQEPRQGARRQRRAGQLCDACGRRNTHFRPDDADPYRHDEVENPARTLRPAAGDRGHGRLALLRGLFVLDRGRVRPFRRPRDLLLRAPRRSGRATINRATHAPGSG